MKKLLLTLSIGSLLIASAPAFAADAPAAAPTPTLEQRISSLEAYINNGDPTGGLKDTNGNIPTGLTTPSVGVPGPGHNAWQMTSSALVLFMTLPGLILFYGGLVRRKNVLSVAAQCFFMAGMVTILWWLCGYSLVFHSGGKFLGGLGPGSIPWPGSTEKTSVAMPAVRAITSGWSTIKDSVPLAQEASNAVLQLVSTGA